MNPIPTLYRRIIFAILGIASILVNLDAITVLLFKEYQPLNVSKTSVTVSFSLGVVVAFVCLACTALVADSIDEAAQGEVDDHLPFPDRRDTPFQKASKNISNEINQLRGRAVVSLIIGIIASATALTIFIIYINSDTFQKVLTELGTNGQNDFTLIVGTSLHLGLIVFIELFAFFFLRQYGIVIGEIRYYINELTNLNVWAALADSSSDDQEAKIKLADILLASDRNKLMQSNHMLKQINKSQIAKMISELQQNKEKN